MKVLITTDLFSPSVNGVVTSVANLREGLERRGHEVRVLTLSPDTHSYIWNNNYYISSINISWFYPDTRLKLLPSHRILKELIEWHPDVVHSQCEFSTYSYARKIAAECNAPLIHTYHTVYEDYTHYFCPIRSLGKALVAKFTRDKLEHTDCVIAPSAKVSTLLHGYHVNKPTEVVPTGIDVERFAAIPSREWIEDKKALYRLRDDELTLLFIGRLAKEKNVEELLEMLKENPDLPVRLLIVGDGPDREELAEICRNSSVLRDRVVFAGMAAPSEVNYYYHLGDCFVNASTSETQGLTYIEAMAAGLPLLCRKDACLDGIVAEGKTGWQYENSRQFADAVRKLYRDRKLLETMSENAQSVSEGFSKRMFATKVENVYRHCLAG